jgi:hypothetical protein
MLITFDATLYNSLISQSGLDNDVISVLDYVARAYSCGDHLLYIDRDTLKLLVEYNKISEVSRDTYRNILGKFTQMGSLRGLFIRRIEITTTKDIIEIDTIGDVKILRISTNYLHNSHILDKVSFLCENMNDALFYEQLAYIYSHNHNMRGIHCSFNKIGGGGSTTHIQYRNICEELDRMCLCIVDRDQKSPYSEMGDNAKNIIFVERELQPVLCESQILDVRDIENLIPVALYRKTLPLDDNIRRKLDLFLEMEMFLDLEIMKYLDIKKGIKLKDINSWPEKSKPRLYWQEVMDKISVSALCVCSKNENECICVITEGLGDVLGNIIENLPKKDKKEIWDCITDYRKRYWEEMGKIIISWGCCTRRRSTLSYK